ncbi:Phosphodiest-domain-containing protein [Testicularia cyperi]|uniref:Phosphodiest-domain-containing protein n=1 Tax=Testicularia cyperi TaxID=1882483 RepID=A0A317XVK4_9BASI|nr:Phosphodiest-domain-containing protein [Testicularia cyperi]
MPKSKSNDQTRRAAAPARESGGIGGLRSQKNRSGMEASESTTTTTPTTIPLTRLRPRAEQRTDLPPADMAKVEVEGDGALTAEELEQLNAKFPRRSVRAHTPGKDDKLEHVDDDDDNQHDDDDNDDDEADERQGLLFDADMSDMNSDDEMELERELTHQHADTAGRAQRGRKNKYADRASFLEDKHRFLFSHPFYHPLRLVLLAVAAVFIVLLVLVSTRSLLHSLTSHAPGSTHPSSITHLASSLDRSARLSNGTHDFQRTVLLISLDGAKPSYLDQGLAPTLQALGMGDLHPQADARVSASVGVGGRVGGRRAKSMQPIFPTLTFPNHWTLLTGLYADSHGIVANDFHVSSRDPPPSSSSGRQFYYTNPGKSWDPAWWLGTPIWASAERSGIDAAVLMWPGPPRTSQGDRPRFFQRYEEGPEWGLDGRLDRIFTWLDRKLDTRPQLICAYAPDIDKAAHKYGPDSEQARAAVGQVDEFIGKLVSGLEARNLGEIVDVVVVSDHGMTETSNDRLVFLDDVLGRDLLQLVESQDGWPSVGLRFTGETEAQRQNTLEKAYAKLDNASLSTPSGVPGKPAFEVYRRAEIPEHFHYSSRKDRIADLWAVPALGWSFTTHSELQAFPQAVYAPRGNHGYSNEEDDMQAIFVARGPSFLPLPPPLQTMIPASYNMQPFPNTNVYNLVADILGIPPQLRAQNNGSDGFWRQHLQPHLLPK